MKVLEEKENILLNRTEVKIVVEADKNPSIPEAAKIAAEKFKSSDDLVAVKSIRGKFGRNTFLIVANIYKSKDNLDLVEPKPKLKAAAKT
ncbi:MAG: hypothetical protein KKB21_04705 [Nanoarchaeota archaeon]|nr:hypothetical protein [Nanoarchaeota archaeon]MBU4086846.1 hypothetical protein [Nanoarchaeota archaeon]